jgi:glucose/mannose-6-phosphate isomerase
LFKDRIKEPYEIVEDYTLPRYADHDTLVVLSSYSGSTEEVVSCAKDALARKARLTAVAGGGTIAQMAKENGFPAYIFSPKFNPSGQPRIGGGYLLMGHLGILKALGLLNVENDEVSQAISFARSVGKLYDMKVPTEKNTAKQLALDLFEKHPFIISAEFLRGFGNGFANQINETAKMISDYRYIPELNHHLMEGLKHPESIRQTIVFLFFLSNLYSERIRKRFALTIDIVKKQQVTARTIECTGKTALAQVLEAYTLSGFTTFYLAMLYGSDPAAIPWVNMFKERLSKP